jgi:hypothetical protein
MGINPRHHEGAPDNDDARPAGVSCVRVSDPMPHAIVLRLAKLFKGIL